MLAPTRKKVPAEVGIQSLIAPFGPPPHAHGNYFWLVNGGGYVINMWAENLQHLVATGVLEDGMVEIDQYTDDKTTWAVVVDERVPENYKHPGYAYFCGVHQPDADTIREWWERYVWTDEDYLLRYTDWEAWVEKRGGTVIRDEESGLSIAKYEINAPPRKLRDEWTMGETEDSPAEVGLDEETLNDMANALQDNIVLGYKGTMLMDDEDGPK